MKKQSVIKQWSFVLSAVFLSVAIIVGIYFFLPMLKYQPVNEIDVSQKNPLPTQELVKSSTSVSYVGASVCKREHPNPREVKLPFLFFHHSLPEN